MCLNIALDAHDPKTEFNLFILVLVAAVELRAAFKFQDISRWLPGVHPC